jgi:DNA-binding transcriptional LysR family regulator
MANEQLTPKSLRYFIQLSQTLNYTQTAQNLGISQPALTQQIKKLEKQFGAPLFYSVGKKIYLSEAGNALQTAATQINDILNNAADQIQQFTQPQRGHIALGILSSAETSVFERFVATYLGQHDDVTIDLSLLNRRKIWERLENNQIDLAVMYLPDENIKNWHLYRSETITADELRLIYPTDQDLGDEVAVQDVPQRRWVSYPREFYINSRLTELFRNELIDSPDVVVTMMMPDQIFRIAARRGYYSALPESFLSMHHDPRLKTASFSPRQVLDLSFVYRREKIAIPRIHTFMQEWHRYLQERDYQSRLQLGDAD